VGLTNTTSSSVKVSVQAIGAHGFRLPAQSVTLAPNAARMLDLNELTANLPDSEIQTGGIRVQYRGMMGDIIVVGGLEDASEGYSVDLPFWPHNPSRSMSTGQSQPTMGYQRKSAEILTLGAIGIMVGYPDSSMSFPGGTQFTPFVTLRNITSRALMLKPVLYLANSGQTRSFPLPAEILGPYEARQLDIADRLAKLGAGTSQRFYQFDLFLSWRAR
jgi:hypothetical protein